MDKKCLLQDLVSDFCKKTTIPDNQQQRFVTAFFQIILEGLRKDKIVKIKGLGTFKLVDVEKRMSVDVNTKERIEIEGHSKISFIPDISVKSQINKPFEQFETVVINEDPELGNTINDKNPAEKQEDDSLANLSENGMQLDLKGETLKDNAEKIEGEDGKKKKGKSLIWTLIVILLMILSYFVGFFHLFGGTVYYQNAEIATEQIKEPQKPKVCHVQRIKQKSQVKKPNIRENKIEKVDSKKDMSDFPPLKGDKYKIVGFKQIHVLQKGETLNKIAKSIYGNKSFVKYIIRYNHLSEPDKIEEGMQIRLPLLALNS